MEFEQYIIATFILIVAYIIRGIVGFGSGLIAIPLLALFLPLTLVVPIILILDYIASFVVSGLHFKQVQWHEIRWLIPFSIMGVIVGSQLLIGLPAKPMLITLACLIFIFAIRSLFNLHSEKSISQLWAFPAAFIGGMVGSLFGTGGPAYVIYLNHRMPDKTKLRATLSVIFFLDGSLRIISFFMIGLLLSPFVWWSTLAGLPIMLMSLYIGGHIHTGLNQIQLTRLIGILLLFSSLSLLAKVFLLQ